MILNERLNLIKSRLDDERFIYGKGLGNDVNFHIFDYSAQDECMVRDYINNLSKVYNATQNKHKIKVFDLFEIMLEALEEKGYKERSFEIEKRDGSEKAINAIKNSLGLKSDNSVLIKKIAEETHESDIVFITGIGKIYPFFRAHKLLDNLQPYLKNPLILFFPGSYTGQSFKLFNEISSDNYYRAFKLV